MSKSFLSCVRRSTFGSLLAWSAFSFPELIRYFLLPGCVARSGYRGTNSGIGNVLANESRSHMSSFAIVQVLFWNSGFLSKAMELTAIATLAQSTMCHDLLFRPFRTHSTESGTCAGQCCLRALIGDLGLTLASFGFCLPGNMLAALEWGDA